MRRTTIHPLLCLAVAVAAAAFVAAAPGTTAAPDPEPAAGQPLLVRPWNLLQHDGAELYGELCASCHGVTAAGDGPAAKALSVPPPRLTHLRRAGIPREHWTYVILSGCEDHHHVAPDGTATMPCWQRIFRQALGNDAASLMVSVRLVDYLESIQR